MLRKPEREVEDKMVSYTSRYNAPENSSERLKKYPCFLKSTKRSQTVRPLKVELSNIFSDKRAMIFSTNPEPCNNLSRVNSEPFEYLSRYLNVPCKTIR